MRGKNAERFEGITMMEKKQSMVKYARPDLAVDAPSAYREVAPVKQLTLGELWSTVSRRKWTMLGFAAIFFALVAAYTFTKTPVYEGMARVQIDPSRSTNLGLDDTDKSGPSEVDSRVKTEIEIIQSNTVAAQVIDALKLYANPQFAGKDAVKSVQGIAQLTPAQRQRLLTKFNSGLAVRVVPGTAVVEIRFKSADPELAADVANSVIEEYSKRNFITRVDGNALVAQWLSKQLDDIRQSTTEAQEKLASFQRDNNLLGTDESDNIVTSRLKQLNEELTQAEAERIVKEGRYRLARSGSPELIDATLVTPTMQMLRNQQAELQAQYAQLSSKFGSGYPKLQELQSQLAQLDTQIKAESQNVGHRLANEYDTASRAENMIRAEFDRQKQQAYQLNEHVAQYAILKHEVESGQRLYDTLQLKLKAAGIASGLTSSYVNVIDRAILPDRPVEPKKSLYLAMGLGGGLFGGLLLGLIRDSADDRVGTAEELEPLMGVPELGSVPFMPRLAERNHKSLKRPRPLVSSSSVFTPIVFQEPQSAGVEAYRALCSVILLSSTHSPAKTLVVTSATSGEGKSTVSCNLATALAQRGKRVLLVDADLRCSALDAPMNARPGLTTMCATGADHHPRYQPIANLPNLHVVPSGIRPTDPTGVLDSGRMEELMKAWEVDYDHIILDTPPVLPFADALVLGSKSDGVILVARAGMSHAKAVLRARDLLQRSGANLIGFVMNAVKQRESYYAYPVGYEHAGYADEFPGRR